MVYARITEGLGNQLFKYACAYSVAKDNGDEIEIDLSGYAFRPRGYMLDNLNISAKVGNFPFPKSDGKLSRGIARILRLVKINHGGVCKIVKEDKNTLMKFHPYDFTYKRNIYLDGYWQNPGYFEKYREKLIQEFSPRDGVLSEKSRLLMKEIGEVDSVAIHIRRGDYSADWLIGEEFYSKAIALINDKILEPKFFVFCEDRTVGTTFANKVKNGRLITRDYTDIEEFFLMSSCKNQIIANSTFSWWAAYLNRNPDAVIIAPEYKQWSGDYYPEEWIKIKV